MLKIAHARLPIFDCRSLDLQPRIKIGFKDLSYFLIIFIGKISLKISLAYHHKKMSTR